MSKLNRIRKSKFFAKIVIGIVIVAVVIVSSLVTAFASTVECTVIDGDDIYQFVLTDPTVERIAEKAVELGMPEIKENDVVKESFGNVIISRYITLTVDFNGKPIEIPAYKGETVSKALADVGINYSNEDDMSLVPSAELYQDTYMTLTHFTPVTIIDGEETYEVNLYGGTVANAINEAGIELEPMDYIKPSIFTSLEYGMQIEISESAVITFDNAFGEKAQYNASGMTVADFVLENDIQVLDGMMFNLDLDTKLQNGDVLILRETEEKVLIEPISHVTIYENSSNKFLGVTSVKQTGTDGSKEVVYRTTYINGEVEETKVVKETVLVEPVTEIIVQGTRIDVESASSDAVNVFTDKYGNVIEYQSVIVGECTAYCSPGELTSLGGICQVGVVAVDPKVIPYGTVMYITSGSVVYGYCVAGDTGSAMRNGHALIDLYYNSEEECVQFGRRDMTVYIIK